MARQRTPEPGRLTLDAIIAQSHICQGETYTLRELATRAFIQPTPVSVARTSVAVALLARRGRLSVARNGRQITEIRSLSTPYAQIDACFYLMVYRSLQDFQTC